jgi:hypothetical protein
MSKRDKDLVKDIERLGYAFDRTNSKGFHFYIHEDTGCEIKIMPGRDENAARGVLRQAQQQLGISTTSNKRNPAQIRERNAAEHARALITLENARKQRESARAAGSDQDLRAAEEAVQNADRKFRYWDKLMRSASLAS